MNRIVFGLAVVCYALGSIGCSDPVKHISRAPAVAQPENLIMSMLQDSTVCLKDSFLTQCALLGVYSERHYNPIWIKNAALTSLGESLRKIIQKADYYGLIPQDYHLAAIDSLAAIVKGQEAPVQAMARLDLLMTDALFALGHHMRHGRLNREDLTWLSISQEIDFEVIAELKTSIQHNNIQQGLESLEPDFAAYKVLRNVLVSKLDSMSLAITDSARQTMEMQVWELAINIEQWRWEPKSQAARRIVVNIPTFKLEVEENDSLVFESNVVVGTPATPTPTLAASIKTFVLFPHWNVPRNIATNELLPKIRKDSAYLKRNRYRIVDMEGNEMSTDSMDWSAYHSNNFPFMIQQAEGEHNALGIVKFTFDNDRSIYLHDTNSRWAFTKEKRAYSHGCVRVERAMDLAKFLVSRENQYCSVRDLDRFVVARQQVLVRVEPVDLQIRYHTCVAQKDGSVSFHEDVYDLNQRLYEAIYHRENQEETALVASL